jgi:hypothetical protein
MFRSRQNVSAESVKQAQVNVQAPIKNVQAPVEFVEVE